MDTTDIQISRGREGTKNERVRAQRARESDEFNKPQARRHLWTDKDIKDSMSNILSQKQQNHINKNKK
jgi:hypothetical protein